MKIIQAGNYPIDYSIIKGGVQSSIFGLTKELAKNNEVTVIAYPKKEIVQDYTIKDDDGINIHYLKNSFKFQVMGALRISKFAAILNRVESDVIHVHESSIFSLLLIIYLIVKQKKFVLTEHGVLYIEQWQQLKREKSIKTFLQWINYSAVEWLCLNLSKRIIVDTMYVKKRLQYITFRKLNVIPQGINSVYYTLQDTPDKMVLLSVGSISPRKGYGYSIDAVNAIRQEFSEIHYTIAGTFDSENVSYLKLLRAKIRALNLDENVCIETNVSFERMLTLYEKANVFILHSLEESQGIVFCEAMAAGKPVLATNAGGIPYVVQSDVNGKLSNVGDTNAFARSIAVILRNTALRHDMSAQNRITAIRYSWKTIAIEVENLYNNKNIIYSDYI
jgi:glycosyltransferase involved in cell wall biosynthesis